MKRKSFAAFVVFLVSLFPIFAWAQVGEDYNIEVEGRYWQPKLDSTVKVVQNNIGLDVKLVDDLGIGERKDFAEGRFQVKFAKKHKFNLSYIPLKWDASKTLTKIVEFAGKTYTVGADVQSRLDLKLLKVGYEYDFLTGKNGFLGGTFDVLVADASVELKAPALSLAAEEKETLPIPMIGLKGRVYPVKWVNFTGSLSGLPLGSYGYVLDAEASLNFNPVKYVGISAGYRYFETKIEYNDNSLDFKLDGPFLTLNVRF